MKQILILIAKLARSENHNEILKGLFKGPQVRVSPEKH